MTTTLERVGKNGLMNPVPESVGLPSELAAALTRNDAGLVCAVVQDATSREVLMVAWMNDDALAATLSSGRATFFSRSRNRLWEKGESSGHTMFVREVRLDCDGDTLLLLVDASGPACHTGAVTCFTDRTVFVNSEPGRVSS